MPEQENEWQRLERRKAEIEAELVEIDRQASQDFGYTTSTGGFISHEYGDEPERRDARKVALQAELADINTQLTSN